MDIASLQCRTKFHKGLSYVLDYLIPEIFTNDFTQTVVAVDAGTLACEQSAGTQCEKINV